MNYDQPNLRKDMLFAGELPRGAYQKLGFGEELMIIDCTEDLGALKNRLYQWGRSRGRRYRVTVVANRTYVKCLPKGKVKANSGPVCVTPTRSRLLAKVARRRTATANRTPWRRDPDTGTYSCTDQDDGTRWELCRQTDGIWLWLIYRNGEPVAKSRTLPDAKAEAAMLK